MLKSGYAAYCTKDLEDARRHLQGTGLSVSQVWPSALKLVDRYRGTIIAVARQLLRNGTLDSDMFLEVVHPRGASE